MTSSASSSSAGTKRKVRSGREKGGARSALSVTSGTFLLGTSDDAKSRIVPSLCFDAVVLTAEGRTPHGDKCFKCAPCVCVCVCFHVIVARCSTHTHPDLSEYQTSVSLFLLLYPQSTRLRLPPRQIDPISRSLGTFITRIRKEEGEEYV